MDFRRNSPTPASRPEQASVHTNNPVTANGGPVKPAANRTMPNWLNVLTVAALLGLVLLLLTAAFALANNKSSAIDEGAKVDTSKYQAVFLNNGQVYFGNISAVNSRYVDLKNVYYLTQAATADNQPSSDYTLVKLGCQQIHYPEDQMLISRDQVTFWENLNNKGKVAEKIEEFKKQNPNGPNCDETTSQTPTENTPSQATNNSPAPQSSNTPATPAPTSNSNR